ncbi:MAG: branched-chain amino acid ABC transporter permease [Deltaproteobacteria bacterium]|jgi:branched-chain amino acid transport system permease protein|nr:branched-chain amino acid ABC transporter permease [Deltaproteobacteria bacterium]MBW2481065.1 branched-chain amino acid ABC transporter permease [Deltaproteobacteria bacterium]
MGIEFYLFILINGLSQGMVLFIVASGLSLVFGVLRVINFAHGSLYMIGAYLAFSLSTLLPTGSMLSFLLLMLLVPPAIALIGWSLEITLFRKIYGKEHLLQLLLTYAVLLILDDACRLIWGGDIRNVARPEILAGSIEIFGLFLPTYNAFILAVGPIIAIGLWFLLYRTRYGNLIRSAVSHPEMVGALGVNVSLVMTGTFMLGCWLAGLGGVLMSALANIDLSIGMEKIIEAFAVVVIGGLGSIGGALLGSLILGVGVAFIQLPLSRAAIVFPYFAMALILIVRPWGLFGKPER